MHVRRMIATLAEFPLSFLHMCSTPAASSSANLDESSNIQIRSVLLSQTIRDKKNYCKEGLLVKLGLKSADTGFCFTLVFVLLKTEKPGMKNFDWHFSGPWKSVMGCNQFIVCISTPNDSNIPLLYIYLKRLVTVAKYGNILRTCTCDQKNRTEAWNRNVLFYMIVAGSVNLGQS